MILKLKREPQADDICACGGKLKSINGLLCLDCEKPFEEYRADCVEGCRHSYAHPLKCSHPRKCPSRCWRKGIRKHSYAECDKCHDHYPLNRRVCRICGRECWKHSVDNGFYYYCPHCHWEVQKFLQESGIPEIFCTKKLGSMDVNELNSALIDHIGKLRKNPALILTWIVLRARSGAGKTEFGCIILRLLAQLLIPIKFFDLPEHLENLTAMSDFDDPRAPGLRLQYEREVLTTQRVLLVDDIYKRNYGEREKRVIYRLILYRHSHGLPTIITTDMSYREMTDLLTERLSSRIKERALWFIPGNKNMREQPSRVMRS